MAKFSDLFYDLFYNFIFCSSFPVNNVLSLSPFTVYRYLFLSVNTFFFLHLESLFKCSQKQHYARVQQGYAVLVLYVTSNATGADW